MTSFKNYHILLGISGGIAAYKSPDIVRRLKRLGADVRVIMTQSAKEFITPLTLQAVSGHPVHDNLFDEAAEAAMGHIELAKWADLILIAPSSANVLAKLAHGQADDLLTTVCLATSAKRVLAPAMNQQMWHDSSTKNNIERLLSVGYTMLGPDTGSQACGDVGLGRMLEPETIVSNLKKLFNNSSLAGLQILITAGPTQEAIDPVRYISNYSSGKMGFAMAQAAINAGAKVTLVSGKVHIDPPEKCQTHWVSSCQEMFDKVFECLSEQDIFIAAAAVSDFRPKLMATQKIKKSNKIMTLDLIRNPDILKSVANSKQRPKFVVGFAAETENLLANAKKKLQEKRLDMVVANQVGVSDRGFDSDENSVTIITNDNQQALGLERKQQIADTVIAEIAKQYYGITKQKHPAKNS